MKFDMDSKCNSASEQDEDYVVRSTLNSDGIGVRKRVKLQEKALDELVLVDPPFVPKKLRSALSRRNCQSTQPSSSYSKRNQHRDFQGTKMLQNTTEEFNKVEEEVAEILISISSYITSSNPSKSNEEVMKLEEKSKAKASSSSFPPLEAVPKEQNTVEEQNTTDYITQKTTKLELLTKPEEPVMSLSKQIGGTHQYLPLNGCRMSQPTQLDSCSVQKQELGPNSVEHKIQTLKPKNGSLMYDIYGKAPNLQFGLHNGGHEQMSMPSSSNTVSYPDAVLGRPVIGSTNLNAPPEKLSLASTDRKRPWNKCITHVYISHLVKDNQKKEMKFPMMRDNPLKTKNEVFNFTSTAINGSRSDMIHPPSISLLDRNNPEESRNHMHSYDPQKQVLCWEKSEGGLEKLKSRLLQLYYERLQKIDTPMDGLKEWLDALYTAGVPCVIVSCLDRNDMVFERMGLNNYFKALVSEEDGMESTAHRFLSTAPKDRPSTKVHAAPGGGSSLGYLFGSGGK